MRSIHDILAISAERKGSADAVLEPVEPPLDPKALAAIPDDRWLAGMTRAVFQAGFNWKVVDSMWPGFEQALHGFDPGWCAHIEDERFDSLISNTAIVRNGPKIRAVAANAQFVQAKDGFGRWIAGFDADAFADLLVALRKEGARLGGTTGQYFLRFSGVDSWILSRDVAARLVAEGVVDAVTPSIRTLTAVQSAFSEWRAQSGYSLKQISRILATSTD